VEVIDLVRDHWGVAESVPFGSWDMLEALVELLHVMVYLRFESERSCYRIHDMGDPPVDMLKFRPPDHDLFLADIEKSVVIHETDGIHMVAEIVVSKYRIIVFHYTHSQLVTGAHNHSQRRFAFKFRGLLLDQGGA
jgi:hypothetical protein